MSEPNAIEPSEYVVARLKAPQVTRRAGGAPFAGLRPPVK